MLNLPKSDRPRERLLQKGPQALSSPELLAILLGSGTSGKNVLLLAQELLTHFGSIDALADASVEELCHLKGVGQAKAIQLRAAFALSKRLATSDLHPPIETPAQAYAYLRPHFEGARQERFGVLLLDTRSRALRFELISQGTLSQTLVHPREVFLPAIRASAARIIIAHNHPSGDPTPSPQDISLTRALLEASQTLAIPIVDHLIITDTSFSKVNI